MIIIDGLEVAISQSMCAVMIADFERWELSTPENCVVWSVKNSTCSGRVCEWFSDHGL